MYALFVAGVLLAAAVTFVFGGGFFLEAWRHRRFEREYLLFGLATILLGVHAGAVAAAYVNVTLGPTATFARLADVALGAAAAGAALLVDFAMCYVRRRKLAIVSATYAFAGVCVAVTTLGYWRASEVPNVGEVTVLGTTLPAIHVPMTWLGDGMVAGSVLMLVAVCGYLIRGWLRVGAPRETGAIVLGAVVLVGVALHDVASLALGLFESVSLIPIGFIVFVYGVAITLVSRYGRLSQRLSARQAELGRRSAELASALGELQHAQEELLHSEQLAVVGEFAAVITHEVRNPMAIVNNAVTSLRRVDVVTDDTRTLLGIIEQEMRRLERLVSHLLNYARPVVPQRQAVDLQVLLEGCIAAHLEGFPDIEHSLSCQGPWPSVEVDPSMMQQAIENVLVNALQAMDGRGELTVRVARRKVDGVRSIIIGFEDTGEGMTEHQLEQAMSPFYTTRPGGTGLGLAICERIVDAHGGMLVVSSEQGVGTAVSLILPEKTDERLRATRRQASLPPLFEL